MKYKLSIALLCATGSALCMESVEQEAQHPPLERSTTPRTAFFHKALSHIHIHKIKDDLDELTEQALSEAIKQPISRVKTLINARTCVIAKSSVGFERLLDEEKELILVEVIGKRLERKKIKSENKIKALSKEQGNFDARLEALVPFKEENYEIAALGIDLYRLYPGKNDIYPGKK